MMVKKRKKDSVHVALRDLEILQERFRELAAHETDITNQEMLGIVFNQVAIDVLRYGINGFKAGRK